MTADRGALLTTDAACEALAAEVIAALGDCAAAGDSGQDDLAMAAVDAFVQAQVVRLLSLRNRHIVVRERGQGYERPQVELLRGRAVRAIERVGRDAFGPLALLDAAEPRSARLGRLAGAFAGPPRCVAADGELSEAVARAVLCGAAQAGARDGVPGETHREDGRGPWI